MVTGSGTLMQAAATWPLFFFFFSPVALYLAAALGFPLVAGSKGYSLDVARGLLIAAASRGQADFSSWGAWA